MLQFPKGFYFGSATSATQSEGASAIDGKGKNIWDIWFEQEPEKFHDRIGPKEASGFYTQYREDIRLLKETGHNSCRISISWSRMFPTGDGELNPLAAAHYHNVIDAFQYFVLHSMDNFKGIVSRMLYGYGTDGKFGLE
jgi:6-phospho-beta-glucosidase